MTICFDPSQYDGMRKQYPSHSMYLVALAKCKHERNVFHKYLIKKDVRQVEPLGIIYCKLLLWHDETVLLILKSLFQQH